MVIFYRLLRVLIVLVFCVPQLAAASTEELRSALKRFNNEVVEHTLSNGLKVLLYRRGVAPIFAGVVVVGVGGVDEVPGHTGMSHLLEHMAFKGTEELGTNDYTKEKLLLDELEQLAKESNGAQNLTPEQQERWLEIQTELKTIWEPDALDRQYRKRGGVGLNATTAKELTTYFINFPTNAFEFWAWIESERILKPVMRQFYRERDVVMEERRMRYEDSPGGKLYEELLGVAYLAHPYRNPVIGYERDLNKLLASETLAFQRKYYVPENMVVAVVGDIDPETAIPVLEKFFGRIPVGKRPDKPSVVEPPQSGERTFKLALDAAPQLAVAYKKPNYPHPDDAPITVLEEIAAGSKISPLYKQLVQKERVAASVDVFEAPGNEYPNLVFFSITPRSPHSNIEVLGRFDRALENFLQQPPTAEQLEIAKRSIAMSFLGRMDGNMSLAQELARTQMQYGDWRVLTRWFEEAIAVSPEDVFAVGQRYFVRSNRTVGRVETRAKE